MRKFFSCLLMMGILPCSASFAAGETTLRAVGVIGNTGEQGKSLLQQTANLDYRGHGNALGCGVALDGEGTLWTRLDDGVITRLSLDGRQLARFPAPASVSGWDAIICVGPRILLLSSGELLTLPVSAAPGTAFKPLAAKLRAISHTPVKGRIAAITEDSKIVWLNPANGSTEPIVSLPDAWMIETDGADSVFVGTRASSQANGQVHKFIGGKETTAEGWPKDFEVPRRGIAAVPSVLQWYEGGFFYGRPGSVSRLNAGLTASPGTILGFQGNTVIGIGADWRTELGAARSVTRIRDGLFVIGGGWGQPFFAEWPDINKSMHLLSWFTARPGCKALSIDADGNVFVDRLVYPWTATPDSFPVELQGSGFASQIARAGPRLMVRMDRWSHGGNSWALPVYSGDRMQNMDFLNADKLDPAQWWSVANKNSSMVFPSAIYKRGDGLVFLTLADAAGGRSLLLHDNGRYRSTGGAVAFKTSKPGEILTSLAMKDDQTLLAALDGYVVEFAPAGDDWQETRRWNSWGTGPAEHFGANVSIAVDGTRLMVSGTDRHRVLCFSTAGGKLEAQFGKTDKPGADLVSLNTPGHIAICGARSVVFDSGNQRLIRLATD